MPSELQRLSRLPDKEVRPPGYKAALEDWLRRPGSKASLLDEQAEALWEAMHAQGLVGALSVGSGKTLLSMLLPVVMGAKKPLILTRTTLVGKTFKEARGYAKDWYIPEFEVISYNDLSLGRVLEGTDYDLIVADEAHKISRMQAARTKRLAEYIIKERKGDCYFCAITGTLENASLHDWYTLANLAFGHYTPIPHDWYIRDELDAYIRGTSTSPERMNAIWSKVFGEHDPEHPGKAFRQYIQNKPGFVVSSDMSCSAGIDVHLISDVEIPKPVTTALSYVERTWKDFDDNEIVSAAHMVDIQRNLLSGHGYKWASPPDKIWMDVKKLWDAEVRKRLKRPAKGRDTPRLVEKWVEENTPKDPVFQLWAKHRDYRPPPRVPVWFSDYLLEDVVRRFKDAPEDPVLVFYSGTAVRDRLKEVGFLEVYGPGEAPPSEPRFPFTWVSRESHAEGHNLQAWGRMVILEPPPTGTAFEQMLGRIHRTGQKRDEVQVYIYTHHEIHRSSFWRAYYKEVNQRTLYGMQRKLLAANIFD